MFMKVRKLHSKTLGSSWDVLSPAVKAEWARMAVEYNQSTREQRKCIIEKLTTLPDCSHLAQVCDHFNGSTIRGWVQFFGCFCHIW